MLNSEESTSQPVVMITERDPIMKDKWHSMTKEEVLEAFSSGENGLTSDEAAKRLEKYGPNRLPEKKGRSAFTRFLMQFDNILIYVLMVAGIITAIMGHWIDTWIIFGVVVINAGIGFVQEGKAERALEGIRKMLSLKATIIRDDKKMETGADHLVPGDIVLLKSGDKIPADLRIIESKNCKIEESPLTGESVPVDKDPAPVKQDTELGSRTSMAYSGTAVTYGNAVGIVIGTGEHTEVGKINRMIAEVEELTTPLLRQIHSFGKKLAFIILAITAVFFVFGYFVQDYHIDELFLAVIGLAVAAIPEGLPAIMTITLAIGVQRMALRNAIIRRLPSVETLGSVSVICSDKTGTLTRNEMTVKLALTGKESYSVEGVGYNPEGAISHNGNTIGFTGLEEHKILFRLLQTIWTCNDAEISKGETGEWRLVGEPTEGALKTLGYKGGFANIKYDRIDAVPFESEHKYMATLNQVEKEKIIFIKGAPERLMEMCDKQMTDNGEQKIDRKYWVDKMEQIAGQGMRIIGAAYKKPREDINEIEHKDIGKDNIFLGLIGIIDPPREEAVAAIQECKEAGIQVKMITGDHAITAKAIGKEIGIGDGTKAVTGKELDLLDEEELKKIILANDVFARTNPEHKIMLIKALQANDRICAMTGDGVNDAPALKRADVGIAMGIKGTEVAKDSSEMVLADDNFASIVNAVEEGRTVYDNIRKAILFILPTNGAESLVLMVAILLGITMPITPAQILWVNMVTAVTLALAISLEPMEQDVMKRPPRDPLGPIVGKYFIWRIIYVSLLIGGATLFIYMILRNQQYDLSIARTVAVNSLVAGQLFYLFNCRRLLRPSIDKNFFQNRAVFIACFILIVFQVLFTYLPFMNTIFNSAPIGGYLVLYPLLIGIGVFIIVELEKFITSKFFKEVN
jgi:P-type Ca2+ transporter type 2C